MAEQMDIKNKETTKIIAVCGKGGVGKTSISAMMAKILMEKSNRRILAIDADPAEGLAVSLGVRIKKTVDDIRNDLIHDVRSGMKCDRRDLINRLDYQVLGAMTEHRNLAFLAIGRPEKEGCYCQVNHLLKEIIAGLSKKFDHVIIDGEAGIEQVNRRVMEAVTHLVMVSDTSLKGINVCQTLKQVASSIISFQKDGLIINRVRKHDQSNLPRLSSGLSFIGTVPESERIRRCDMEGNSILSLSDCAVLESVHACMMTMGLLHSPSQ